MMSAVGEFASRVRGYFTATGKGLGRVVRRGGRDLAITIEERPDVGPVEVEVPYPLPTREEPLAYVLFYISVMVVIVTVTASIGSLVATGQVPFVLVAAVAGTAVVLGVVSNLVVIANYLEGHSTSMLHPLVGAGKPLLNALHYWFNPAVALLALVFVLIQPTNNWMIPISALALVAWMVTGLLLKLPGDSPWNGPMLERWAGTLHKRPFIYIVLMAMLFVGIVAELVY